MTSSVTFKQIIEEAGRSGVYTVPLLRLLEFQYSNDIIAELNKYNIDSDELICFAVNECTDYWRNLALDWLASGYHMNQHLATELESFGRGKSGNQQARHKAFIMAVRWKKDCAELRAASVAVESAPAER